MANREDFNGGNNSVRCSFCGKTQDHVRRMISGPNNPYLYNECVLLCNEIVSDDVESIGVSGEPEIKKPQEIKEILTQARKDARTAAAEAAAPKAAVTCPWCGGTSVPDANGCCQYCGGSLK